MEGTKQERQQDSLDLAREKNAFRLEEVASNEERRRGVMMHPRVEYWVSHKKELKQKLKGLYTIVDDLLKPLIETRISEIIPEKHVNRYAIVS